MSGWGAIYANTVNAIGTQSKILANLQEQISTGRRVSRVSDDPASAVKIMSLQSQSSSLDTYLKNVSQTSQSLQTSLDALQQTSNSLTRVKQLLTQASSGTYSDSDRAAMADEVDALLEQDVSLANTSSLGQYGFAGQDVASQPYVADRTNGKITGVRYAGSQEQMYVPVGTEMSMASQLVGDNVFKVSKPEAPMFLGSTGAAAGTSPSTVTGDLWLTVADGGTTSYDPASQLAAGASAGQDTILGAHTVTIDAAAHMARLDDGTDVSFTGAENDLELTNSAGQSVHVDMTGWSGADGSFQVSRSVSLSLDGGTTTTTVTDFSNQVAVSDPSSGGVLMVDPSGITAAGTEPVTVPGTYDLFNTLINIRDLLANTRDLSASEQQKLLIQAQSSLSTVTENIAQKQSAVGSKIQALDTMTKTLTTTKNTNDDQVSSLQDSDAVEVATELARTQTLYQMTLASASKLLSLSLLDFVQ